MKIKELHKLLNRCVVLLATLGLIIINDNILAQVGSFTGEIVYVKVLPSNAYQIIRRDSNGLTTFDITQNQSSCYAISPSGHYLALSTAIPSTINIIDLVTQNQIAQYPWQQDWISCAFRFVTNSTLRFSDPNGNIYDMNALNGNVTIPIISTPSGFQSVFPPQWIPNDLLIRSTNPALVLYNRCDSGQTSTTMDNQVICTSVPEIVIYDLAQERDIQHITDITLSSFDPLSGVDPSQASPPYDKSISWSPSGRYLAYITAGIQIQSPSIRVFDLQANTYINTEATQNYTVSKTGGFSWSNDETKLLFWLPQDYTAEGEQSTQIAVLNLQSGTVVTTAQSFSITDIRNINLVWSPDSSHFAFKDADKNLQVIDTVTGSNSSLDDNLVELISWELPIAIPTPTPTATHTPTATPTQTPSPTPYPCPCTLFGSTVPANPSNIGNPPAVNLGVVFKPSVNGQVTGIRFYKLTGNGGTHKGYLWSSTGTQLGNVTFSGETATGWQTATFATPINVTANTVYMASYHAPQGRFAYDNNTFTTGRSVPPLYALATGETSPGNGTYIFGAAGLFPNATFNATNYWVDVVFSPT